VDVLATPGLVGEVKEEWKRDVGGGEQG
jgi:hypothetical protein